MRPRIRAVLPEYDAGCPFCPGNEEITPPEIFRTPATGEWQQRVVPNKYPALQADASPECHGHGPGREMDGLGEHEVLIESRLHNDRPDKMDVERLAEVVRLWRDRYLHLSALPWARAVLVFRNFGERAGATLDHPHSQAIATPVTPPEQHHRMEVADHYLRRTGRSVYEELIERERSQGDRVVAERSGFLALAPFASRMPFETWILPLAQDPSFGRLTDERSLELAWLLREILGALREAAGDPDVNVILQTAPVGREDDPAFRWHLIVLPRTTTAAGFELASGMEINSVAPERAAALLRETVAVAAYG